MRLRHAIRFALVCSFMLLIGFCLGQTIEFTVSPSSVSVRQGHTALVNATIRNTGTQPIYLNQLSINLVGGDGLTVTTDGFEENFEGVIQPGVSYTNPIYEVSAPNDAALNTYQVVAAVLGGADEDATDKLGQRQVGVTVTAKAPPTTFILTGIGEGLVSCATSQTFTFSGTDDETPTAQLQYQWRLDQGIWSSPSSNTAVTVSDLGQGPHKFEVAAINGFGKVDPNPAARDFSVDLRPLQIMTPSVSNLAADSATFKWTTNRAGNSHLDYRKSGDVSWTPFDDGTRTSDHSVTVSGLSPSTDYIARLSTTDDCGNAVLSDEIPFHTLRMKVLIATPDVIAISVRPGAMVEGDIILGNIADGALTNLKATVENVPQNLSVVITPATSLASGASGSAHYQILASNETVLNANPTVRVYSDSGDEAVAAFQITVVPRRVQLVASPSTFDGSMLRGQSKVVELKLTNTGDVAATNLAVQLPKTDWMTLASTAVIASLKPGDSVTLSLNLSPSSTLALGPYQGNLVLQGDNAQMSLPFVFRCASLAKGSLAVTVTDEATYFVSSDRKVSNARVTLSDPSNANAVVAQGLSDSTGLFLTDQLPEGHYNIEVTEAGHSSFHSSADIAAGSQAPFEAFLPKTTLTYTWQVLPQQVQDTYLFNLVTTFETTVPAPVITIFPAYVDTKYLSFDPSGNALIKYTITNHGKIACNKAQLSGTSSSSYSLTFQTEQLGTLPAESSMTVTATLHKNQTASSLLTFTNVGLGIGVGSIPIGWLPTAALTGMVSDDACDLLILVDGKYVCGEERDLQTQAYVRIGICPSPPGGGGATGGAAGGAPSVSSPAATQAVPDCKCLTKAKWDPPEDAYINGQTFNLLNYIAAVEPGTAQDLLNEHIEEREVINVVGQPMYPDDYPKAKRHEPGAPWVESGGVPQLMSRNGKSLLVWGDDNKLLVFPPYENMDYTNTQQWQYRVLCPPRTTYAVPDITVLDGDGWTDIGPLYTIRFQINQVDDTGQSSTDWWVHITRSGPDMSLYGSPTTSVTLSYKLPPS